MRRHGTSGIGLRALRRERLPFVVLSTLILALQLFLTGLSGAAMAAGSHGAHGEVLCIGGEAATKAPQTRDHRSECPCLAGSCVQAGALAAPSAAPGDAPPAPPVAAIPAPVRPAEGPDLRPFTLFARAGRGPPALS